MYEHRLQAIRINVVLCAYSTVRKYSSTFALVQSRVMSLRPLVLRTSETPSQRPHRPFGHGGGLMELGDPRHHVQYTKSRNREIGLCCIPID